MPNDPHVANAIVALVATYLLHSTVLLAGVWLVLAVTRSHSASLQERLWKLAALAPLLTAPLQLLTAKHFGDRSLLTLPAIVVYREGEPNWEGEAPAEPRGTLDPLPPPTTPERPALATMDPTIDAPADPPDASLSRQPPTPPQRPTPNPDLPQSTDTHLVEIIPGPDSSAASSPSNLPTIVPAPADSDVHTVIITPRPSTAETGGTPFAHPIGVPEPLAAPQPGGTPFAHPNGAPEPVAAPFTGRRAWRNTIDTPLANPPSPNLWRAIAASIFATLFTLGAARLLWRAFITRCRLWRTETISSGPLREALDQLLAQRNIRHPVRLAQSASAVEPAAGGVIRWLIIVPPGISQKLTSHELQALLAHELAHLVRRDPLWLWIAAALCWCLPIQPLNFLAARRWRQAAEELCDDWAIAGGVRPLTLANCLTRVAEWRLAPMPLGLTSDVGQSRFARRISRLVNGAAGHDQWSRPARRRFILAAAAACIALLTLCGPRMQAGPPAVKDASAKPEGETPREGEAPAEPHFTQDSVSDSTHTPLRAAKDAAIGTDPRKSPIESSATNDAPVNPDTQSEINALLTDLERVESLIGQLDDDPEITATRARLRERLQSLRGRMTP